MPGPSGRASDIRSLVHGTANPVFRMPPGYSVEIALSASTLNGVIATRLGGWVWATNSWLIPGYETPTIPTRLSWHPRLGGDRLDGVVAVEALGVLEVAERAAAAAGAAHVDADVGVAEAQRTGRRSPATRGRWGNSPSTRRRSGTGRPSGGPGNHTLADSVVPSRVVMYPSPSVGSRCSA